MSEGYMLEHRNQHYLEMIVDALSIFMSLCFLYSYIKKKVYLAKLVFYWILVAAVFQIAWFIMGHNTEGDLILLHSATAALYIYLDCIVVSFIQRASIVSKLSDEHFAVLEEWDAWELGEFMHTDKNLDLLQDQEETLEYQDGVHQDLDQDQEGDGENRSREGRKENLQSLYAENKPQSSDWTKSLDFQNISWNLQETYSATRAQEQYRQYCKQKYGC